MEISLKVYVVILACFLSITGLKSMDNSFGLWHRTSSARCSCPWSIAGVKLLYKPSLCSPALPTFLTLLPNFLLLLKTSVNGECKSNVIHLPKATLLCLQSWRMKRMRKIFIWLYSRRIVAEGFFLMLPRVCLITTSPLLHEITGIWPWRQQNLLIS